jgi:hypothetical protein
VVQSALQRLKPEHRDILVLREYKDLGYSEIAEALDISLEAVKSRIFRARSELKILLSEYFEEQHEPQKTYNYSYHPILTVKSMIAKKLSVLHILKYVLNAVNSLNMLNLIREEICALGEVKLANYFAARVAYSVEKRDEQSMEWLGIEPLARNTFIVLAGFVLIMFFFTSFNNAHLGNE